MKDNRNGIATIVIVATVVGVSVFIFTVNVNSVFAVVAAFIVAAIARIALAFAVESNEFAEEMEKQKTKQIQEQAKMDAIEAKRHKQAVELEKVLSVKKYAFTSDDFHPSAQSILVPIVNESRRSGIAVTGKSLIEAILRSFR